MLRLRTLGCLALEDENGPLTGAATQRRRLALLAMLAAAGERGVSRDKLVAYFWPESDAKRAHHALAQLLYALRRSLSVDPVIGGAAELRLDPKVIGSDAGEFDRALEAGDRERAVALYGGPFLDGFHLGDAPEFERWAEGERAWRAQQVAAALEVLAEEAAVRGDAAGAVGWWQKRAALDPLNSRVALALMSSLDAAGNRPGALWHARIHEALVREELGTAPDPAVLALAERLREAPVEKEPEPSAARWGDGGEPGEAPVPPEPQTNEDGTRSAPSRPSVTAARHRAAGLPMGALLGLLLVLLLAGVWATRQSTQANPPTPPSSSAIAVLPFSVHGGPEYAYLGDGMVDLLSTTLDGVGDLRTVDPRALLSFVSAGSGVPGPERGREMAARFGAGRYVLGAVVEEGGRLRITASLYSRDRGSSPVARAAVEGGATEIFRLVDELTAELLAEQYTGPRERLVRTAAATTHSLPALKAYLEGEAHFRAGRYDAAVEAFEHAVAEDTAFALAYYRLSMAADWAGRLDRAVEVSERAMRHSYRLSEHDSLLVEAYHAWRHGRADESERLYRTVLGRHPDDVEAWYQLGEVLFHYNPYRGRSFVESRGPFERVLSFEPDHRSAVVHLVRVTAYEEKRAELDSLIRRALALTPESERLELRAFRAFALESRADQDRIIEELRMATQDVLWHSAWRIAVYGRDLAGAERIARLLVEPARPSPSRMFGHTALAALLLGQGQWQAKRAEGVRAEELSPHPTGGIRTHFAVLPFLPLNRVETIELRDRIARLDPAAPDLNDWFALGYSNDYGRLSPQIRAYLLGLLSARLGEVVEAQARARELDAMGTTPEAQALARYFAAVVRADVARSRNRPRDALALLDQASAIDLPMDLQSAFGAQPHAAWLRAEVLRELGRDQEALTWYASRAEVALHEVIYLAPAHFRQGEIHERLGNPEEAIEHYARFVELWKDADPELQSMLTEARRRLARLQK